MTTRGDGARADSVSIWSACDGLLLLRAVYRGRSFPRHTHATYVVGINERSVHSFYCRRSRHVVPPGTIALVNPEEVHTGESASAEEWRYRGLYPEPAWIERMWVELSPRSPAVPMFVRPTIQDNSLALALARFHRMSERSAAALAVESAGVAAFGRLLLRYAEGAPSHHINGRETAAVRRMREFLHANSAQPVSLTMLAEVAGLGRFGALHAFRRTLGIAPYEYLTSLRLERARLLLLGGAGISSAAISVGFSDQSHLTRRFKRHFGMTPGAFVRAVHWRANIVQDGRGAPAELANGTSDSREARN